MAAPRDPAAPPAERLTPASEGAGPLLQRDYWAVLAGCDRSAAEVAALVRERFVAFPPEALVTFTREGEGPREGAPLAVGDVLRVAITGAPETAVGVVHADDHSLTLGTAEGHPEAGRITFGAYPNRRGDVVFHIRSRARSASPFHFAGFVAVGEPMQTNTWTDFIDRLAHTVGDGVVGAIRAETVEVEETDDDRALDAPTFIAREDG
ncbi:MAG: DUF1990 family protein [Rubricoccaceae bacterium]|nr:DUF1990 family protein [Rubricoccaceae bacterium]